MLPHMLHTARLSLCIRASSKEKWRILRLTLLVADYPPFAKASLARRFESDGSTFTFNRCRLALLRILRKFAQTQSPLQDSPVNLTPIELVSLTLRRKPDSPRILRDSFHVDSMRLSINPS